MNHEGSNTMRTSLSSSEPRSPRRLAAVAVFTALCLGSSQALSLIHISEPTRPY